MSHTIISGWEACYQCTGHRKRRPRADMFEVEVAPGIKKTACERHAAKAQGRGLNVRSLSAVDRENARHTQKTERERLIESGIIVPAAKPLPISVRMVLGLA